MIETFLNVGRSEPSNASAAMNISVKSWKSHSFEYALTEAERSSLDGIIKALLNRFESVESIEAALACEAASVNLPPDLYRELKTFSSGDLASSYMIIQGFQVDDELIGPSPQHWDQPWSRQPYLREEFFQLLISSTIGGVFGWRTQENGRFLRHIVPIRSVQDEQLGGSSRMNLLWHTEEAFHRGRADYFTLMCYRNHEKAITNISCIDDFQLPIEVVRVLRQPRFVILPDKSHTPDQNNSELWQLNSESFQLIQEMINNPQPVPLIYGRHAVPMMRIDQAFVSAVEGDEEAAAAIDALHTELDRVATHLVMSPGELVVLDNLRVAHGRSAYKPNYGAKHRWMRRVNIANGRRTNFDLRDARNSRVML